MTTTEQILVVILSSFLAVFLLLSIIALTMFIKLLGKLRRIADSAAAVTSHLEAASAALSDASGPLAFGKAIGNIFGAWRARKKGKHE